MMLRTSARWALLLLLAAGSGTALPDAGATDDSGDKRQRLGPAERQALYHLSQGAESIIYSTVKALHVRLPGFEVTTRPDDAQSIPFLSMKNLRRYGFIENPFPDRSNPLNPEKLPIGLSLHKSPISGALMLGTNCAACHVGKIRYLDRDNRPRSQLLDGGPNMIDFSRFFIDIFEALAGSLKESVLAKGGYFDEYKRARSHVERNLHIPELGYEPGAPIPYQQQDDLVSTRFMLRLIRLGTYLSRVADKEFVDVYPSRHRIMKLVEHFPIDNLTDMQRRFLLSRIHYYLLSIKSTSSGARHNGFGRTNAFSQIKNMVLGHYGYWETLEGPVSIPALYHADKYMWHHYTGNSSSIVERNLANGVGLGALVDRYELIEYDGFGPFRREVRRSPPTFESTIRVDNVARMEDLFARVAPPHWPADAKPVDPELAEAGKRVFIAHCAGCHTPRVNDRGLYDAMLFNLKTVGTDGLYYRKLRRTLRVPADKDLYAEQPGRYEERFRREHRERYQRTHPDQWRAALAGDMFKQRPYTAVFEDLVNGIRNARFADLTRAEIYRRENVFHSELNPQGQREPGWREAYTENDGKDVMARPLDGIWATAPYLHNGSIPTLADLLRPPEERPEKFYLGHRFYDLERVGYELVRSKKDYELAAARYAPPNPLRFEDLYLFDTSQPGNSNAGHEFGTALNADKKRALLEFLKSYGAGRSEPHRLVHMD